jgi:hypothetical protein
VLASAVEDALSPLGVRITRFPMTPQRLVALIAEGREARSAKVEAGFASERAPA